MVQGVQPSKLPLKYSPGGRPLGMGDPPDGGEACVMRLHKTHFADGGTENARLENARTDWLWKACLLYTSPSPRDRQKSRMPSSA